MLTLGFVKVTRGYVKKTESKPCLCLIVSNLSYALPYQNFTSPISNHWARRLGQNVHRPAGRQFRYRRP